MTIAAEGNAEAASPRAVPWRAGLAAAGTSVMFGFAPLAARGLYADGLSTWSRLCWRYLLLIIIFAGIRLTRLRPTGGLVITPDLLPVAASARLIL